MILLKKEGELTLYFSASANIRSISSLLSRPLSLVMVILELFPVVLSDAFWRQIIS